MKDKKIVFVDGTLREGEQSAGVFFTRAEKIRLLKLMESAGIGIADCGMPAVSTDEFGTIKKLASLGLGIKVGASVRCIESEIALFAKTGASDCFIIVPASDIHLNVKFGLLREKYLEFVKKTIGAAVRLKIPSIHVVFEDATRADENFIEKMALELSCHGVRAFYICDTIGVSAPEKIGRLTKRICAALSRLCSKPDVGVHCHNDFGLALANTISAYENGASYLTFTQNGIGERAGNVKFHELAMALAQLKNVKTGLDLNMIGKLSLAAEEISGIFMPATEPFVGFNAYRHESGIHVSGLLKNRKVYEEFSPEAIGRENEFVLGKHSGISIVDKLLSELFPGEVFTGEEKSAILKMVKNERIKSEKAGIRKMKKIITKFHEETLGGLSLPEFINIVEKIRR